MRSHGRRARLCHPRTGSIYFETGYVERQRGHRDESIARTDTRLPMHGTQEVDHSQVLELNAFRPTC